MFRTASVVGATLCLFATTTAAQSIEHGRVGFGVALNPIALADAGQEVSVLPLGLGNFTVPIWVSSRVRLEPELGILKGSSSSSGGGGPTTEFNQTVLRYGIAAHFVISESESFGAYAGPRIGFARQSQTYSYTGAADQEIKQTNHYIGIAIGGEYWLASHFSLGAEVQISRIGIGDEEVTGQTTPEGDTSFISNNGVISVRFYL